MHDQLNMLSSSPDKLDHRQANSKLIPQQQ